MKAEHSTKQQGQVMGGHGSFYESTLTGNAEHVLSHMRDGWAY